MAKDYTSAGLIKAVKRRGSVPTSQQLFEDADFCGFFTDALRMRVIPRILKTREEHFIHTEDRALVAGQSRYELPERAIGSRLRQVYLVDINNEDNIIELPRIEPEDGVLSGQYSTNSGGGDTSYYFEDCAIVLTSEPRDVPRYKIRFKYHRRPSDVVPVSECAEILSIDTMNSTVTVGSVPESFVGATSFDIVNSKPGFKSCCDDAPLSFASTAATIVVVSPEVLAELKVGAYICHSNTSPVAQIPVDLHEILIQYALVQIMESLGDARGMQLAAQYLAEMEDALYTMLEHRDQGSPRVVSLKGTLWRSGGRRGNRWGND